MRTFKKVVAWIMLVVSVIGILSMLVGIIGSWVIRNQVTVATVSLITAGETAVNSASFSLNRIDNRLTSAQRNINAIEDGIVGASANLTENSLVGTVINNQVSEETTAAIGEVRATIVTIADTIYALDEAIKAANQLPFVNLDGFITTLVGDLVTGIESLEMKMTAFRTAVESRREDFIANSVGLLTGLTSELSGGIEEVLTSVNDLETQLNEASINLAEAKVRLPRLFTLITIFVNIFALFMGVAFASLLLHSWAFTQNPDLTLKELATAYKAKKTA